MHDSILEPYKAYLETSSRPDDQSWDFFFVSVDGGTFGIDYRFVQGTHCDRAGRELVIYTSPVTLHLKGRNLGMLAPLLLSEKIYALIQFESKFYHAPPDDAPIITARG